MSSNLLNERCSHSYNTLLFDKKHYIVGKNYNINPLYD